MAHPVLQEHLAPAVLKVLPVLADLKARKGQVEELAQTDNQALRELQGRRVTLEHLVSMVE